MEVSVLSSLSRAAAEVSPDFKFCRLHSEYARLIKLVIDGGCKRLIVNAPPRHHKTEFFAKILPAAFLSVFPESHVGVCPSSSELANSLAGKAFDYYCSMSRATSGLRPSKACFSTRRNGQYWAIGQESPVLGRKADLLILDDLVRGPEQANCKSSMDRVWEFYLTSLRTRLSYGGAVVVVCSRSGVDDLVGRISRDEAQAPWRSREAWTVVDLQAISEAAPSRSRFPAHFTVEPPLWNLPGAILCPELYIKEDLEGIKLRLGSSQWNCQYQQRPS